MNSVLKRDKEFKEAVGAFIIAFSEFEHGLAELCAITYDLELLEWNKKYVEYLEMDFSQKREAFTSNLKLYYPELLETWEKINVEIGQLNRHRRFIAHGFAMYTIPNDAISTFVKQKGKVVKETYSASRIRELTQKLYHLNTGENGVWGNFRTKVWESRKKLIEG